MKLSDLGSFKIKPKPRGQYFFYYGRVMFAGCSGQELTGMSGLLDTDSVSTAIQSMSGSVTKIKPSGFKDYGLWCSTYTS